MSALGIAATFAGGVGLFLLGMRLLTDGLKVAAGSALRESLARSTGTAPRALLAGVLITALVQSSSAVTVATIGFVNAGLIALGRAVWVVYGSNVGTTATGWIVAATGLSIHVTTLALPLVGVGTLVRLTGPLTRRGAIGEVFSGFGLFFIGLGFLQTAMTEVAAQAVPGALGTSGVAAMLGHFLAGLVLTVLTQSSSAALAVTITAASAGIVPIEMAGAMVIGSNIGTTSTAALATLEATPNARRTAAAHVAFNCVTALVALALLPWLVVGVSDASRWAGGAGAAFTLALFHTVFNVGGVLLMWPLSRRIVAFLEKRFDTPEEATGKPRHLDSTVLGVPSVALEAIRREQGRLGHAAVALFLSTIAERPCPPSLFERRRAAFDSLLGAISSYAQQLDRARIPAEVSAGLEAVVHASQHYAMAVEQAEILSRARTGSPPWEQSPGVRSVLDVAQRVATLADPESAEHDRDGAREAFGALEERYTTVQAQSLRDAAAGELSARDAVQRQQLMAEARRGAKHLVRATDAFLLRTVVT